MSAHGDQHAYEREQAVRMRKLFASVVLACLDDAVRENKATKSDAGSDWIRRWARSKDGCEVLSCAGIEPSQLVVDQLVAFVDRGVRTSVALSREEADRKASVEDDI